MAKSSGASESTFQIYALVVIAGFLASLVLAWAFGYGLAFMFDRLMALWVFTATFLTSTVLVPIFMGLYWKRKRTPLAGMMSSADLQEGMQAQMEKRAALFED